MTLIALSGRKNSGKSTISNYLVNNEGFSKISFADYLKELIINVFLIDKSYLYDQNLKELKCFNFVTDLNFYKKISKYVSEDVTYLFNKIININTSRELLQFIGTDILRAHDENFHVKKTLLKIQNNLNTNFVCDDVRFKNELLGLKSLNAEEYFIIRPYNWNVSNHASEISINWFDINKIIINNNDVNILINSFNNRYSLKNNNIIFYSDEYKNFINMSCKTSSCNDAFIGGFLCEHKISKNLLTLEIESIKNVLSDICYNVDALLNNIILENIKYWLDPNFPPNIFVNSWDRGREYYKFYNNIKK